MELRVGDRIADETGQYEVIGRIRPRAGKPRTFASRKSSPTSRWSEFGAHTSASRWNERQP